MPDDHALLLSYARSRDAEAFALLVKRYSVLVFSVAKRVTGNTATAEDVTQDCFFALARHAASIRGSLSNWLHRVALNRSLQVVRNESRRQRHEDRALRSSDLDDGSRWQQMAPLVDVALAELPEELREPLVQHFLLGRPQTQVAENLHVSQSTVYRRLQEGIERLREHLKRTGVACGAATLSAILAKNANSAVPARLSTLLGKMALAGPGAVPVAASTAAVAGHGVLKLPIIKGAFILMALHNAKAAIVIGAGVLLTAATAVVVYENQHHPSEVKGADSKIAPGMPKTLLELQTLLELRDAKDFKAIMALMGRKGSKQIAEQYSRDVLSQISDRFMLLRLGGALYDEKRYSEALEVFERLEKTAGEGKEAKAIAGMTSIWKGFVLDLLGRRREAVSVYLSAYRRAKENKIELFQDDSHGLVVNKEYLEERIKTPFTRVENTLE
jgi:RNA polymerase sigma factor (sigma-70 family)